MNTTLDFGPIYSFYSSRKSKPWPFQEEAWRAYAEGKSGMISVPTGSGKTYAAFCGPLAHLIAEPDEGVQILYISPLRAITNDIAIALQAPIDFLGLPYQVEKRTGDTTQTQRRKQKTKPPAILLITPESLALLLNDAEWLAAFKNLKAVLVDEWHELLGTKRGVMLELLLAQLTHLSQPFRLWGMSATLGNMQESADVLGGGHHKLITVTANIKREVIIRTLLPNSFHQMPWSGFFGLKMLPFVAEKLDPSTSTLVFTNTRAQSEKWFEGILYYKPEWKSFTHIHHGSIAFAQREAIENAVKHNEKQIVVCTSSLDLGVDFPHVQHVMQIGSPKSVIRLVQRAGRSNHTPFSPCLITLVPTHVMELLELMSLRIAVDRHAIESRQSFTLCYDVLIQHLISRACGGGFEYTQAFNEIKTTHAFKDLSKNEFDWAIRFLVTGGESLSAYDEYKKLTKDGDRYFVESKRLKLLHKMNIGTIPSNATVKLKLLRGQPLGTVEEGFISRLSKGDAFIFGGQPYELVAIEGLTAVVRKSKKKDVSVVRWMGSRMPLSSQVSVIMREYFSHPERFQHFPESDFFDIAMQIQMKASAVPIENEILVENISSREGHHLFFYPFESRSQHQTLNALIALRLLRSKKSSITLAANDYGCELLSRQPFQQLEIIFPTLFEESNLEDDLQEALNMSEMAKSTFRDIARISGLIVHTQPGRSKALRHLQMTSSLLFEVFEKYDPSNLLLIQAQREAELQHIELDKFKALLHRLRNSRFKFTYPKRITPMALPLYIEHASADLSTESLLEIVEKLQKAWAK